MNEELHNALKLIAKAYRLLKQAEKQIEAIKVKNGGKNGRKG